MTVVLAFNGDPVKEEETGYLLVSELDSSNLTLSKIVTAWYEHPDEAVRNEGILIPVLEERHVTTVKRHSIEGAAINMLYLNQKVVRRIEGIK